MPAYQQKFVSPRVIRGNRGDLLSRWGILSAVATMTQRPVDVFCSRQRHLPPMAATSIPYGRVYNLFPPLSGWRSLAKADVVLWTGGLDLQDDSSLAKLCHTWLVFFIYRLLGLKIVCVCQGAGPLESPIGRFLARAVLSQAAVFMARDKGTFDLVTSLRSRARLVRSHDGIFLPGFESVEHPTSKVFADLEKTSEEHRGPLIAINMRLWFHFTGGFLPYQFAKASFRERADERMSAFVDAFVRLIGRLRTEMDARVVLVSMYEPGIEEWEDDAMWLGQLKARFADDRAVLMCEDDLSIPEFITLMKRFDLVIGTRLHSTLTALRQGVRAIHLSYTIKGRDIFDSLGLAEFAFDLNRFIEAPDQVFELARTTIDKKDLPARIAGITANAIVENLQALDQALVEACTGARGSGGQQSPSHSRSS
ncbi:polysaccharide pyruvyl transferase family protein [Bradyrhizobium sp. DASA03068]|uniref:polysaccharide pyruvyl transferase family protein n=1 Tax=Bradyrhizobium sp. BLXBL-01 TaxID=3395915 RepID=UPI003F7311BB